MCWSSRPGSSCSTTPSCSCRPTGWLRAAAAAAAAARPCRQASLRSELAERLPSRVAGSAARESHPLCASITSALNSRSWRGSEAPPPLLRARRRPRAAVWVWRQRLRLEVQQGCQPRRCRCSFCCRTVRRQRVVRRPAPPALRLWLLARLPPPPSLRWVQQRLQVLPLQLGTPPSGSCLTLPGHQPSWLCSRSTARL